MACAWACAMTWVAQTHAQTVTQGKPQYQYFRTGSAKDVAVATQAGFALMGGGKDLDEAFRWMCERAGGGDFLVLRARGDDDYNPYIAGLENGALCKLNSVATLILPNREAAMDPFAAETIAQAEAIFIAGGDQANYIRYWMGTPVQAEINKAIQRGVPVGGTSAGLAVLGEWAYSAEGDKPDDPNLDAKTALADPMGPRVTLVHSFLEIPVLKGIITDSHFVTRDRMGRLVAFLAVLNESQRKQYVRGLGIDERTAVLLEPSGKAKIVGKGSAYLLDPTTIWPIEIEKGKPLDMRLLSVAKVAAGQELELAFKSYEPGLYQLRVESGVVHSSQAGGSLY